jgi:EmrB/QacA subfamily drug resistance transporter
VKFIGARAPAANGVEWDAPADEFLERPSSYRMETVPEPGRTSMPTTIRRWRAFAVLAVSYFMTIIDLTIVNVALPTIGRKLNFDASNLSWIVTAYGITFGGLLLLAGRAADLLGRRRVFMIGLAVFTTGSLACALATDDTFLIVMRAIQGVGAATVLPAGLAIVMNMFTEGADRNKALGAWGALGPAGATVGLISGGLLVHSLGWEYIFYINVPIGAVALALTPRLVPESRREATARRYDIPGGVAITAALMLAVYGIATAPQHGWTSIRTIGTLAAGAALIVAFFAIEATVTAPILPPRLLRNRHVAAANAVAVVLGGGFFSFLFTGTLYMQQILHYSALQTGYAWLGASLASLAFAGPSQLLATKIGVRPVLALGMAMVAGGIALATRTPVDGHFWANLAAPMIVTGAGTAFAFIPISIAGLTGVTEDESGLASGLINTTQQLGGSLGVALVATVAATRTSTLLEHHQTSATAMTSGFHQAFAVSAAIAATGILLSLIVPRRQTPPTAVTTTSDEHPTTHEHTETGALA